jgi:hypothetical protein
MFGMHARREADCEGLPGAVPLDRVAGHCDIMCSVQSRRAASIWQHELGAGARIGRCCHVTVACGSGKDPCCLAWGEQRETETEDGTTAGSTNLHVTGKG